MCDMLERHDFDYLIYGGWGLDLLNGAETRIHDDVDIFLWHEDRERFRELLLAQKCGIEQVALIAPLGMHLEGGALGYFSSGQEF